MKEVLKVKEWLQEQKKPKEAMVFIVETIKIKPQWQKVSAEVFINCMVDMLTDGSEEN